MLDFRHQAKRHVVRLGANISRTVAREIAQAERGRILRGEAGIGKARKDIVFERATDAFLAWARANLKPTTVASYAECLARLGKSPLFAGKRLGQITPWQIERFKQERAQGGARVRPNREIAVLKTLFNRMRAWEKYEGANPVVGIAKFKEPRRRLRYLEPAEETALLDAAREPLRSVILVGIHAGLRIRAEALQLRWCDVDLARSMLTVQAAYAKNGISRTVPLNSVLREMFARLKATAPAGSEMVFLGRGGKPLRSIRNALETACAKAQLVDVTPHTFRHSFASRLAMAGVDVRTIQELGGWRTLALVERYAHLSPGHRAEAVERLVNAAEVPTRFTTPAVARRGQRP
jgi:integrase